MLRTVFVPKRDEETGVWGKLNNEELNMLYSSHIIVWMIKLRRMRRAGHITSMEKRGVYRLVVGNPEVKMPLGRPRIRWEESRKMDLLEVECEGMDWIELSQDKDRWWAFVNVVMYLRDP